MFVVGYFGFGNAGDDAIGVATIAHLQSMLETPQISVTSGGRPVFSDEDVRVIQFSWGPILREISATDEVILTGGSHFHDRYARISSGLKVFAFYLLLTLAAKALRKNIYLLGHGIGPLRNPLFRALTFLIICISDAVTVRDPPSQEAADCRWADVRLAFDIAALLNGKQTLDSSPNTETVLGISVTPAFAKDFNQPEHDEELLTSLSKAINQIGRQGNIDLVSIFVFHTGEFNDDDALSIRLEDKIFTLDARMIRYEDDPLDFLAEMGRTNRFVGMKYHSLVFAYLNRIPSAAISYHPKCQWFRDYVGYDSEVIIKMEDAIVGDDLEKLFSRLVNNPDGFQSTMSIDEAKTLARCNFDPIIDSHG